MSEDRSDGGSLPTHVPSHAHQLQISIVNQLLSPTPPKEMVLIPHQGTATICIGMSVDALMNVLGPADDLLDLNEYLDEPYFSVSYDYYNDGIEVLVKEDHVVGLRFFTGNENRKVVRNFQGSAAKLSDILPLNSKKEDVVAALGEPVGVKVDDTVLGQVLSAAACEILQYDGIEIKCRLDDGRVISAEIGETL